MGPSIAGLLVMAVFFAGLMMLSRTTLLGEVVVSRAMTDAASVSSKRSNTDLTITESVIVMGDECTLNISVKNQGATTIYDFNHMDVIVQFTGGNNISRSLTYDSGEIPSASDEWTRDFPPGSNLVEPGIFNPGETMTINGQLTLLPGVPSGAHVHEGEGDVGSVFNSTDTTLTITDSSGFVEGQDILIDDEKLNISSINGQDLTVARGVPPTAATVHQNGASIFTMDQAIVVVGSPNGVVAEASLGDLMMPCP